MLEPPKAILRKLGTQQKEAAEDVSNLQKKLKVRRLRIMILWIIKLIRERTQYLERESKSTQSSLNEFYSRMQIAT